MTLPEHAICSLMLAQLGVRQQYGTRGVVLVTIAGVAPDLDAATKLFGDEHFWNLHHALGHSLLSIAVIAGVCAGLGRFAFNMKPAAKLFAWCFLAAFVHCLTDALYWWGVEPLWPASRYEVCFNVLEYLDLIVLAIWLTGAGWLFRNASNSTRVASVTLACFAMYVALRAVLPAPTGVFKLLTGGWMYAAPQRTPVLDWW